MFGGTGWIRTIDFDVISIVLYHLATVPYGFIAPPIHFSAKATKCQSVDALLY